MRRIVFIILLSFVHDTYGQELDHDRLQQAIIFRSDNSVWLESDIKLDHRFFGYEKPDTTSGKLILFSVFTPDVEDNPYHCPLGLIMECPAFRASFILLPGMVLL